jgi:hypothetical protein
MSSIDEFKGINLTIHSDGSHVSVGFKAEEGE